MKVHEDPTPLHLPSDADNYPSATENYDTIKETYTKERDLGMTAGPFECIDDAAAYCGVTADKVCLDALGVREERDKVRTIHDGTVHHVNGWIQKNIPEKTTAPRPADLVHAALTLDELR